MAYNKSKAKGTSSEYEIRDYFRNLGYEAHRVPASGAAQGFPGDVLVKGKGETFLIEVKRRKDSFKLIYKELGLAEAWHFSHGSICVSIARDYSGLTHEGHYPNVETSKAVRKIFKIKEFLGKADTLVIRDDRKPWLFIKYR